MKLTCLGSGSTGNCYLLTDFSGEVLILDAGVKFKAIQASKRLASFSRVAGAVVTHEHKDHSLCAEDLRRAGITVLSPRNVKPVKKYRLGSFDIMPFVCKHDVINYGFIVRAGGKTLAYATDTAALPPIKADYWLVECNYTEEAWENSLKREDARLSYLGRVRESHMSIEYLDEYFAALKAPQKAIIACHLSEHGNADTEAIRATLGRYAALTDISAAGKEWTL